MTVSILMLLITLRAPTLAPPTESDVTIHLQNGIEALKRGQLEEAYRLLLQGLEESRKFTLKTEPAFQLRFYLGLTLQEAAKEDRNEQNRLAKLASSCPAACKL